MSTPKKLTFRVAAVLFVVSVTFSSVGCLSVVERLVPQEDPAPTSDPTSRDADTAPVVARPTSRPVPRAERPTGVISTQPAEVVASEVIDASGGTIQVEMLGDAIDGLVLEVPEGAYAEPRQFEISSAPITDHTFGDDFNPLSSLITIENGGDYSDEFMLVTVPIDLPEGWFAMPVYYDESTGGLEGIPFSSLEQDSITVVTRHFSSFTISGILDSKLDGLVEGGIDSGFRPGADDWQFTNYGSYIAPNGHCAGQAISAMWYYCEQPDGEDPFLWGLYDNNGTYPPTPELWEDDSYGYRLASTTQSDIHWENFEVRFQRSFRGKNDEAHFKAFAYSIHLTGEPQYVGISSSQGGGHAMIVYRVESSQLFIADPNYPGVADRRIEYADGRFSPYNSGANRQEIEAGRGRQYESIGYMAKTAMVDWNRLAERWREFKNGTIGDDRFPQYQVLVVHDDDTREPLIDGYESEHDRINIVVSSPGVHVGSRVYRDGQVVPLGQDGKYALEEGYNLLGFEILGDVNQDPTNRRWRYIDFQYLDVWYGELDCHGWVLESVTTEYYVQDDSVSDSWRDFAFDFDEGAYSSTGTMMIRALDSESQASFTHTGTWTPLPNCIAPGESVTIRMTATSDLVITPPRDWGMVQNSLTMWDGVPQRVLGHIYLEARSGEVPDPVTLDVELSMGDGLEGITRDIGVTFSTDTGNALYRYTYAWRE